MVADDDGTPTSFRMPVEVGANASERFTAYVRPGGREPEITIRLIDANGRRVGGAAQATVMPQPPEALMPNESLILTLGRPQGVEAMVELPGFKVAARGPYTAAAVEEIVTARIDAQSGSIPGRWYGYDAARAIVLDTNDREAMAALDACAGRPLVDWVERGGHLVVAVGANWQARAGQRAGADPAGIAQRPGESDFARGARHLRRLEQADHAAGHPAGAGHQARGGRGAEAARS